MVTANGLITTGNGIGNTKSMTTAISKRKKEENTRQKPTTVMAITMMTMAVITAMAKETTTEAVKVKAATVKKMAMATVMAMAKVSNF